MEVNALILVDIQNDFLPGGALAVPEGDVIIPVVNRLQPLFELVLATQDWHPPDHGSFAASHPGHQPGDCIDLNGLRQILWPTHCVQGTRGAEFAASLDTRRVAQVFRKGTDRAIDSYSGFFDNGHRKATGLGDYLKHRAISRLCLAGLATDYCVKFTALDAISLGFRTTLVADACRGVNLQPDDSVKALRELEQAGVEITTSAQLGAVP